MSSRKTGRVKVFDRFQKAKFQSYGFIIPDTDDPNMKNEEVFVHHTAIHNAGGFKSLAENEPVEFELIRGPKGYQATYVTGPNGQPVQGDPNAGRHQAAGGYVPMGSIVYGGAFGQQVGYGFSIAPFMHPYPQQQIPPYSFVGSNVSGSGGVSGGGSGNGSNGTIATMAHAHQQQAFVPYMIGGYAQHHAVGGQYQQLYPPYGQSGPS
ncbi:uncharacterized protein VTP21DRAFT_6802 [Calcarisporiella thermophila]|uniref:uncharacterized protein n=1 Tax=Calcarisporiella thermophila TaxID=911321 RepID=UPI0037447FB3